jgi:hypothetical protein
MLDIHDDEVEARQSCQLDDARNRPGEETTEERFSGGYPAAQIGHLRNLSAVPPEDF